MTAKRLRLTVLGLIWVSAAAMGWLLWRYSLVTCAATLLLLLALGWLARKARWLESS